MPFNHCIWPLLIWTMSFLLSLHFAHVYFFFSTQPRLRPKIFIWLFNRAAYSAIEKHDDLKSCAIHFYEANHVPGDKFPISNRFAMCMTQAVRDPIQSNRNNNNAKPTQMQYTQDEWNHWFQIKTPRENIFSNFIACTNCASLENKYVLKKKPLKLVVVNIIDIVATPIRIVNHSIDMFPFWNLWYQKHITYNYESSPIGRVRRVAHTIRHLRLHGIHVPLADSIQIEHEKFSFSVLFCAMAKIKLWRTLKRKSYVRKRRKKWMRKQQRSDKSSVQRYVAKGVVRVRTQATGRSRKTKHMYTSKSKTSA